MGSLEPWSPGFLFAVEPGARSFHIRRLVRVIALAKKTCFVPVLSLLFGRFGSRDLKARGIPGWEINLISWLGNQPILSSWLENFLCVFLGKRNR